MPQDLTSLKKLQNEKAPIDWPVFTGAPKAPTPALGTADTTIATTEFVSLNSSKLNPATTTTLGGIIVGNNLEITPEGVLSAVIPVQQQLRTPFYTEVPITTDIPYTELYLSGEMTPGSYYDIFLGKILVEKSNYSLAPDGMSILFDPPISSVGDNILVLTGILNTTALTGIDNTHAHSDATSVASGYMSSTDKVKIDTVETWANNYVLPVANSTTLGGVVLGTHMITEVDGKVSIELPVATSQLSGTIKIGNSFLATDGVLSLKPASSTILGGVKVSQLGGGISITNDGTISMNNPLATNVDAGIVIPGDRMSITPEGVINPIGTLINGGTVYGPLTTTDLIKANSMVLVDSNGVNWEIKMATNGNLIIKQLSGTIDINQNLVGLPVVIDANNGNLYFTISGDIQLNGDHVINYSDIGGLIPVPNSLLETGLNSEFLNGTTIEDINLDISEILPRGGFTGNTENIYQAILTTQRNTNPATPTSNGLMSAADKVKMDAIFNPPTYPQQIPMFREGAISSNIRYINGDTVSYVYPNLEIITRFPTTNTSLSFLDVAEIGTISPTTNVALSKICNTTMIDNISTYSNGGFTPNNLMI